MKKMDYIPHILIGAFVVYSTFVPSIPLPLRSFHTLPQLVGGRVAHVGCRCYYRQCFEAL